MKKIKMYGERNTNTNYLSKLLELNLNVEEVPGVVPDWVRKLQHILPGNESVRDLYFKVTFAKNLGWKHSKVKLADELEKYCLVKNDLKFITVTKNPYSWLLSLYKNPYHQYYEVKPSFEAFLSRPWNLVGRDNLNEMVSNPIELWNLKNRSYLSLPNNVTIRTTTESIFMDAEAIISDISTKFNIEMRSNKFINYERSTKNSGKTSEYYRDYYLNEKWRSNLTPEAIEIVNDHVDKEVMSYFGYDLMS